MFLISLHFHDDTCESQLNFQLPEKRNNNGKYQNIFMILVESYIYLQVITYIHIFRFFQHNTMLL